MKAILLAAGFGTRLYPLTRNIAKPLLEVGGQPVLSHILDRVSAVPEVDQIVVVGNGRFHDQLEDWRSSLGTSIEIKLLNDGALSNDERLGGVADMLLGMDAAVDDEEPFLVAAGDNLIRFDLCPYVRMFLENQCSTLFVRTLPEPVPPRRHGEVLLDASGRVTRFREKPEDPKSNLAAACLYLFPASVREELRDYLSSGGNADAPGHFIAWLVGRTFVRGLMTRGELFDIGNLESLAAARAALESNGEASA